MNAPWTPEQDEMLRRLWCIEGLSASGIAARLTGFTRNAVSGRVWRLGLRGGSRPASTRAQQNSTPKPAAERRGGPKSMLRFGKLSIRKSAIAVEPKAPERLAGSVTLIERRSDQCGWPVNDGGPFLFCGAEKSGHKHYCDDHAMRVYRPARRVAVARARVGA